MLRLVGEIDAETVTAYRRRHSSVAEAVAAVDLTDVRFLSSSAVSFLIRQTQPLRQRGQLPVLCGVSGQARRVLELTGTSTLFALAC